VSCETNLGSAEPTKDLKCFVICLLISALLKVMVLFISNEKNHFSSSIISYVIKKISVNITF
jgi:hypothetical protein